MSLLSDSAGGEGLGFGVNYQGRWCQAKWPDSLHTRGLTLHKKFLELFPIVVAVSIWGKEFINKKNKFCCDNIAVVSILNKLSSKSEAVMCLVCFLTLQCLKLNISVKATHIPGRKNEICDALSRLQLSQFRELALEVNLCPHPAPEFLWNICDQSSIVVTVKHSAKFSKYILHSFKRI